MPQKIQVVSTEPRLVSIAEAVRLSEEDNIPGGPISRATFDRHLRDGSLDTVTLDNGEKRLWWPLEVEFIRILNLHPKRRAKLMGKANGQTQAHMDGHRRQYIGVVDTGLLEQLEEAARREREANKRISELIAELKATREAHERELVWLRELISERH